MTGPDVICHAMSKKLKLVAALVAIVLVYRLAVKE
jgi:hypothetical protein